MFTCSSIRVIHLDFAFSVETGSFLQARRRFITQIENIQQMT